MARQGGEVSLPQAVIDQEKEAEELHAKLYPKEPEGTPPQEETPPEAEETAEESAPAPEPEGKAEVSAEKVQSTDNPEPPKVDNAEYERLKAAHSTLLGKYNAEVPRQADTIRSLEAKVHALEARLAVSPAPKSESSKPATEDLSGVYAQMENDFGKDFSANFRKAVQAEARAIVNDTFQGVRGEVENIGKSVAKSREDRFLDDLTRLKPNWRETYSNPLFVEMLNQVEPFTGKTFGTLAQEANDALDASRVAKVYDMFDKKPAATATPVTAKPPGPKPDKEALIAPSPVSKATVSGGEKADYIKAEDIERFYQDVSLGKYSDKPAAMKAKEERINKAISNRWVIG